ncbi:hypothetical protein BV898_16177 [Hypsibius exemplaris]|uniref:Uncharacterized protein n=1 Tax=Hypsibius exemplaris TaxID=2072580 RepID=A0A9X6NCN6_HYPEX|nr:hypothetical protein BV898_16177 [Hypsibius exemplaris]
MSDPNLRPLRTVRDLRDNTWMVRDGLAEIELKKTEPSRRYELSKVPYLGTDGTATALDIVPHPRKIYEDDSDYIKRSKRGGSKHLIWWHPDYPLEMEPEKSRRLLRPKPAEWSVHPASLLPNPHANFAKVRKLPPTHTEPPPTEAPRRPGKVPRLEPSQLVAATGAPRKAAWEPELKTKGHNFYKIITNGYLPPYLHESRKVRYFESLLERPKTEQEKLQDQLFHEQRQHNRKLRERAQRFDRMTRGKPSWTEREHMNTRSYLFPQGWGRGMRAPPVEKKAVRAAVEIPPIPSMNSFS